PGFDPAGAIDGKRFIVDKGSAWQGKANERGWWWQARFSEPRAIGALLQIQGGHPLGFRNAPKSYVWQISDDGKKRTDLDETKTKAESRLYRIHRLSQAITTCYLRLRIDAVEGTFPTLREVEIFDKTDAKIPFDDWIISVCTYEKRTIDEQPDAFTQL